MPIGNTGMVLGAFAQNAVSFVVPGALALAALKALGPWISGGAGERRVGSRLERLFPEVRHDLIVPDDRGGLTQIDHLALTPAGLLVVETKTYRGSIFGTGSDRTWTQAIGGQRNRFQNPIRQNYAHIRAVQALVPDVPVEGLVVFAGDARFPKGLPDGVCLASEIADELAPLRRGEVSETLQAAWERLGELSRTDRAARKEHLQGLQARFGGVRSPVAPAIALGLSLLWLGSSWFSHRSAIPEHRPGTTARVVSKSSSGARTPFAPAPKPLPSRSTAPPRIPAIPPTTAPARPMQTAPGTPAPRAAGIEWATDADDGSSSKKEECAVAIAAVLIANTPENQRTRDRACGLGNAP